MYNSLYGNFRNLKFSDIWSKAEDFVNDYKNSGLYIDISKISDELATTLFYLLYAKYGNSVIASSDNNRFKYMVYELIFSYGPTWEKELKLQNEIRSLNFADIVEGATQIQNHSFNPSTEPSTQTNEELTYINEQQVFKTKRGKGDSYALLIDLLKTDVTNRFLDRFKKLFLTVVMPEKPLWYVTEEEEDNG